MKIKITVTKEIYRKAMWCGVKKSVDNWEMVSKNCAVALAVREIAPNAAISYMERMNFYGEVVRTLTIFWNVGDGVWMDRASLSEEVNKRVVEFDALRGTPHLRLNLPEFSFEVYFPDALVEEIGIDELNKILSESKTLAYAI